MTPINSAEVVEKSRRQHYESVARNNRTLAVTLCKPNLIYVVNMSHSQRNPDGPASRPVYVEPRLFSHFACHV